MIAHKEFHEVMYSNVTKMISTKDGTDLVARLDLLCQHLVFPRIAVVPMLLDGCKVLILLEHRVLSVVKCAITGVANVVTGTT